MYQYNDNELLYLIYEGSEEALELLFDKYKPLILKRINSFHIKKDFFDDYLQEGYLSLYKAVQIYKPEFNKTFNKFFDLILQRRFMTLLQKNKKTFYYEILFPGDEILKEGGATYSDPILSALAEEVKPPLVLNLDELSDWERKVYTLKFENEFDCKDIADVLGCDIKSVYNAIFQIRKKLKDQVKNHLNY